MNDSTIEPNNPIFKTLHEIDTREQHETDKQERVRRQPQDTAKLTWKTEQQKSTSK
jgi:hypothetical protein